MPFSYQREEYDATVHISNGRAVLRSHRVQPIHQTETASASHIDGHDCRLTRDKFSDMARNQATIDITATAD